MAEIRDRAKRASQRQASLTSSIELTKERKARLQQMSWLLKQMRTLESAKDSEADNQSPAVKEQ